MQAPTAAGTGPALTPQDGDAASPAGPDPDAPRLGAPDPVIPGLLAAPAGPRGAGRDAGTAGETTVQDRLITAVAFFFYVVVFASVAAMSYRGLMAFAEDTLGLTGAWRFVVPVSLDGAAVSASFFGYRAAIHGEPAFGPRILVCLFGGASAFFNWHEAAAERGLLAAAFYAAMSVLVVVMFDLGAKQIRRRALARQGKLEPPLPRFRLARWLLAPVETFRALRIAALETDLTAEQAVRLARLRHHQQRERARRRGQRRPTRRAPGSPADTTTTGRPPTAETSTQSAGSSLPDASTGTGGPLSASTAVPDATADLSGWDTADPSGWDDDDTDEAPSEEDGAEAQAVVLDMLRAAVAAGRPLTGRDVSDRVGCHTGEGRKLLREARLQHLRGLLAEDLLHSGEVTAEEVVRLYQVRVDHAQKLLDDARREGSDAGDGQARRLLTAG